MNFIYESFQNGVFISLYQSRDRFVAVLIRNLLSFESLGPKKGPHGGQGKTSHRDEKRDGFMEIRSHRDFACGHYEFVFSDKTFKVSLILLATSCKKQ